MTALFQFLWLVRSGISTGGSAPNPSVGGSLEEGRDLGFQLPDLVVLGKLLGSLVGLLRCIGAPTPSPAPLGGGDSRPAKGPGMRGDIGLARGTRGPSR